LRMHSRDAWRPKSVSPQQPCARAVRCARAERDLVQPLLAAFPCRVEDHPLPRHDFAPLQDASGSAPHVGKNHAQAGGETTERRIRINRPDDESAKCKGSRARGQPKDFPQSTPRSTTHSTASATSSQQERTEPFWPQLCRRGAKSSPPRDFSCGTRRTRIKLSTT